MMEWIKTAPFAALSLATALTVAGCLSPATDETAEGPETEQAVAVQGAAEATGEAEQAQFGCGCGGDFWFRRFPGVTPWNWCGPEPFLRFSDGIFGCW